VPENCHHAQSSPAFVRFRTPLHPIPMAGSFGSHDIHRKMNGGGTRLTVHTGDGSATLDKF